MRKFYAIFLIFFLTFFGFWLILSPQNNISFDENRTLSKFPKLDVYLLANDSFTEQVEKYAEDHFPKRNVIIEYIKTFRRLINFNHLSPKIIHKEKFILLNNDINTEDTNKTNRVSKSTDSIEEEVLDDPSADFKAINGIFLYENKGYQFFGGGVKSATRYATSVNSFTEKFSNLNKIYTIIVPSSTEFYLPKSKYQNRANSEKKNIKDLYSKLNSTVKFIDIYPELFKNKKNYLYFKTDHHWTARGAYIAYKSFASIADFKTMDSIKMPIKIFNANFIGSLHSWTKDISLRNNPDSVEFFDIPMNNISAKAVLDKENKNWINVNIINKNKEFGRGYGIFLGLDYPLMDISGSIKNERRLLIIKDSYANAFIPFLVNHFEKIYVADIRYFQFKLTEIISDYQINEVLFMNNIVMANNPYFSKRLNQILK